MLIENGLKPVWVFDGKPPQFKSGEVIYNIINEIMYKNYILNSWQKDKNPR